MTTSTTVRTILRAQVALPIPNSEPYDYEVPQELVSKIQVGVRVKIPLRSRTMIGVVVNVIEGEEFKGIRPIQQVLDEAPVVREHDLELSKWISDSYYCSWGEAVNQILPRTLLSKDLTVKDLLKRYKILDGEEIGSPEVNQPSYSMTEEQQVAYDAIISDDSNSYLLHGITGSGKTEVYLRLIENTLKQNKTSICLFPEIALSEQIKHQFIERFGDDLEILHSRLTPVEQLKAWLRIKSGLVKIVLGPRSALYAPFDNLGLIIMDEEQEFTYKQDQVPRYQTREVAKKLASLYSAKFVMGTATPSLETRYDCSNNKVDRLVLSKRVVDRSLPSVEIVDLSEEFERKRKPIVFSDRLKEEINKNIENNQGSLIFLNRRGFSTFVHCLSCGEILTCGDCEVSLTFHMGRGELICHYCEYSSKVVLNCPDCNKPTLKYGGMGTEKLESECAKIFPTAKIARVDSDIARKKGQVTKILNDFKLGKIDILIGTQMIAKGFDFPQVTLVGVILADVGLSLPDFRSNEKTFQLLTQVAGRAGRGDIPGRVIIQSYLPAHHVLQSAITQDYEAFYEIEIEKRRELNYPPFAYLANIIFRAKTEKKLFDFSQELKNAIEKNRTESDIIIIGPAPLPIYKLRGYYRWHLMLKADSTQKIIPLIRKTLTNLKRSSTIQVQVDIDPVSVL